VALAASALLLSACASLAPVPPQAASGAKPEALLTDNTDYHGRFAVHYVDNNGEDRNVYGNFELQQSADSATLQLLNPLGQTMARVTATTAGATLELPGHAPQSAPAVEDLMQRTIGFPLPMDGLRYWLKPEAAPGSPAQTTQDLDHRRLTQIRQDGWTIDYRDYYEPATPDAAAGLKRVDLSRVNPPLDVKLVIDR
jgi:outer membrane lipoprotein LolB